LDDPNRSRRTTNSVSGDGDKGVSASVALETPLKSPFTIAKVPSWHLLQWWGGRNSKDAIKY
jgi:hypothetical protein